MSVIHGIVRHGQIVLDDPADLAEGTRVEVVPLESPEGRLGMRESDWPTTADGIAALMARMDLPEPGWLSAEDDASWRNALNAEKEREKSEFLFEGDNLRRIWE